MTKSKRHFEFTQAELEANFSAVLSVLAEQETLIAVLLSIMAGKGILKSSELTKITDTYINHESLPPVYSNIYKRYAYHFIQAKRALDELYKSESETKDE